MLYDPSTPSRFVWVVETLPARSRHALLIYYPIFPDRNDPVVYQFTARIESVAPAEPRDKQHNNYAEAFIYDNGRVDGFVSDIDHHVEVSAYSRSGPAGQETILFDIIALVYSANNLESLIDTVVKVELTPGLKYLPEAEATKSTITGVSTRTEVEISTSYAHDNTENSGEWDIGSLPSYKRDGTYFTLTLKAALDADLSENEQCLTATITGLPGEELRENGISYETGRPILENNIARACVDVQQPGAPAPTVLSDGRVSLFTWYDCVSQSTYPCDSADNESDDGLMVVGVLGTKAAGDTISPEEVVRPRDFVVHVSDPLARRDSGGQVFWYTGYDHSRDVYDSPGVELLANTDLDYMQWGVDPSSSGKTKASISGSVSGVGNKPAPGAFASHWRTSSGGQRDLWPMTNGVVDDGVTATVGLANFPIFFAFYSLGTYEFEYTVTACYGVDDCPDDNSAYDSSLDHSDTETYTFHVGPMADLAVGSAWQTAQGVAVAVVNNGPDPSPGARVELVDTDDSCDIGPLTPITGVAICTIAGAQLGDAQAMVTVVDDVPYEVCANLDYNRNHDPISEVNIDATESECVKNPDGSWLSVAMYDPNPNNDTSGVSGTSPGPEGATARARQTNMAVEGETVSMVIRSHSVSWEPLEELFGWEVSHYEVERLDPANNRWQAIAVVSESPYDDTDEERGSSPRYRVRAVNVRGQWGPWAETGASGTGGLPRVTLALDPATINEPDADAQDAVISATVTATLDRASAQNFEVVVSAAPADEEGVAFTFDGNRTLTIPAGQRESAGVVTITALDDSDAIHEQISVSAVAAHAQGNISPVTLTIVDDDAPNLTLGMLNPVPEGGTATYTVALNARPSADVTVTISSDNWEVTVNPASLTFTDSDWNSPKTVTVSAAHDDDAVDDTFTLTHGASGAGEYRGLSAVLEGTVDDDDMGGIGVTVHPMSLDVNEGGGGSYTLVLDVQPTGNVRIDIASGDTSAVTVNRSSVTFSSSNWNTPQTVTVSGVNDADSEDETGTITHTIDAGGTATEFGTVTINDVTVTTSDDDTAGVRVSPTSLSITEGGSRAYTLRLNTQPSANVTINVSSDNTDVTASPAMLTFTPDNWSRPQTVTVTAGRDDDAADDSATLSHRITSDDMDYSTIANLPSVRVTVDDRDTPGVTVTALSPSPVSEAGRLTEVTEGEGDDRVGRGQTRIDEEHPSFYTVVLNVQPTGDVVIDLGSDHSGVTVSPAPLTFTRDNWNVPQTVEITAAEDGDKDDAKATIKHTVDASQSSDEYDAVRIPDVPVTVDDNDDPGVTLIQTGPLVVREGGTTMTYQIVLDSQPDGNVVVGITSSNPDKVKVSTEPGAWSSSAVIFSGIRIENGRTHPDWDQPQTITVTALADGDADDETVTLTHTITTANASSGTWDVPEGTRVGTVTVTVRDDDGGATSASRASGSASSANAGYARAGGTWGWAAGVPVSYSYDWGTAESLTLRDLWRRPRRAGRRRPVAGGR